MKSMAMAGGMILLFLLSLFANVYGQSHVGNTSYLIVSKQNSAFGLTMAQNGSVILSQVYSFRYNRQLWTPYEDPNTDLTYIINENYGAGLSEKDGKVYAKPDSNGDYWELYATEDNFGDIRHNSTAKELTVENATNLEGSPVILETWQGKSTQLWSLATLPPLSESPEYGGTGGRSYDHGTHAFLIEINIKYDDTVIHYLNVTYIDSNGVPYNPPPSGGENGGDQEKQIRVNIEEEHLHKISGTYHFVRHRSRTSRNAHISDAPLGYSAITSISFHIKNNHNGEVTEFGPYGTKVGTSFESPNGEIIGLHGKSDAWLDAIGTWYYPETWHTVDEDRSKDRKSGPNIFFA